MTTHDQLDPVIWGPHFWTTFHYIAATYSDSPNPSIKSTMKNFIQSIPVFLPCSTCQDHAFAYIKSHNLDKIVSNRKEIFTFFFNFHNEVNKRLNKPLMKMEDALNAYSVPKDQFNQYLSIISTSGNKNGFIIFFILGFVLTFFLLKKILKKF